MNYKKIYNLLIENAKQRGTGKDNHHIVPKSLGGSNDDDNLVLLTHKEHYVAHHLLAKFSGTKEMTYAFRLMTQMRTQRITSRVYENLKKDFAQLVSETHKGKVVSKETKDKLRKARAKQTFSDETRAKLVAAGKKRVGELNHMFGKKHSEETKRKFSEDRKGENHPAVDGHYITPWGKFLTAGDAAEASEYDLNLTSLRRWCKQNNNKPIRRQSYLQCQYLNDLGEDVVGKTFKEIGFWHEKE